MAPPFATSPNWGEEEDVERREGGNEKERNIFARPRVAFESRKFRARGARYL